MNELLPFQQLQTQLAAFIRDPENTSLPPQFSQERIWVYSELVFNNLVIILSEAFPVCCSIFSEEAWEELARDFFKTHKSISPYFYEIPKEFLEFLAEERNNDTDPEFLYELAHYEWVELALEISDASLDFSKINRDGDLLEEHPVISPLAWILQYHYPVHKIGKNFLPDSPGSQPTFLAVLRNEQHKVEFVELSVLTAQLLSLLISQENISGKQALLEIATTANVENVTDFIENGSHNLIELKQQSIILGTYNANHN